MKTTSKTTPRQSAGRARASSPRRKRKSRPESALAVRPAERTGRAEPPRRGVYIPRKASRMVKAIFRANNPVQIAGKLLDGEGDATAGKLFLQLLEYLYGKPDQQFEAGGPGEGRIVYQFVTTAPRPQYPTSSTSGAVAGAASNSAAILAPRSNGPETTQEDKHE